MSRSDPDLPAWTTQAVIRYAEERSDRHAERGERKGEIELMPPNERCPHCSTVVEDWHFEWCPDGAAHLFYRGQAMTDCPVCLKPVSYQGGALSVPAAAGLPLLRRQATKAAEWSKNNGITLEKYLQGWSAGQQYLRYFSQAAIQQADSQAQGAP